MGEALPYSRKTKRRPSITRRAKIAAAICFGLAAALVFGGLYLKQQETIQANAEAAAGYSPAPLVSSTPGTTAPSDAPLVASDQVLIIGDSFVEGQGLSAPEQNAWPHQLAALAGWQDVVVDGFGGSGFVREPEPGSRYGERLGGLKASNADADLIIIQGSVNDAMFPMPEVSQATTAALKSAVEAWPDSTIILTGPITAADGFSSLAETYAESAEATGVRFIPATGDASWLPAEDSSLISADGIHPSLAGHEAIAAGMHDVLSVAR